MADAIERGPHKISDKLYRSLDIFARLKPGVSLATANANVNVVLKGMLQDWAGPQASQEHLLDIQKASIRLQPAGTGKSLLRDQFHEPLWMLMALVGLVLLIACANVANLMTAKAAARAREMALRVSIGAGRLRLVQLVLVESAWIASLAAVTGGWFALWSAPFVVSRMNPSDNPARLSLPADWRVFGFGVALSLLVTLLFGLAPALHAAAVNPSSTLKGGTTPHSRRRWMNSLIAVQVAFCFLVLFVAGLFAATFDRLSHKPLGFSPERLLAVETVAPRPQPAAFWDQALEHLRQMPGVESVALAGWPLLAGNAQNSFISANGAPPGPELAYFLTVSPGWIQAMKLPLIDGRDFHPGDTSPGAAIVSETFAKQFYGAENPVGKTFAAGKNRYQVVGLVRDSPYRNIREAILPVVYVPFHRLDGNGGLGTIRAASFMVRTTSANPLALASIVRREIPKARPEFRVSNIRTQEELFRGQTVRERLLSMLALFFAAVALLLAGIGLYGVLDYAVVERRREIGIRIAIGAEAGDIARRVTADVFVMVLVGAAAGLALGMLSVRSIAALLYGVRPADPGMLAIPIGTLLAVTLLSALPAVIHAVRIDAVAMLRGD
jgi:predicted permease